MKLTLRGFQSHLETALDIRGRLVCVTGPNNVGKSAIVRAARWLLYDALRGSKFARKDADEARVELEDGGRKVARVKSRKGRNAYELDGKSLDSIGTGSPEEVQQALGVRRASVDKDLELELNVVQQKEHPFLMEETGTAKAKILNALTGLHVLDIAMRSTAALVRSWGSEEKSLCSREEELSAEAASFSDLPIKEAVVSAARFSVESLMARAEKVRLAREDLRSLVQARQSLSSLASKPKTDMAVLEALWSRHEELAQKISSATALLSALASSKWETARLSSDPIRLADIASVSVMLEKYDGLSTMRREMEQAFLLLGSARTSAMTAKWADNETEIKLAASLAELKSMVGAQCPECGQALTEACLAEAA